MHVGFFFFLHFMLHAALDEFLFGTFLLKDRTVPRRPGAKNFTEREVERTFISTRALMITPGYTLAKDRLTLSARDALFLSQYLHVSFP